MTLTLIMLALGAPAHAQDRDRQFRKLTLVDGRTLTAEILATEATGLQVRTPQGESLVSFELLLDMVPAEQVDYADQKDWVVYVTAPDAHEDVLVELIDAIPGVIGATVADPEGRAAGGLTVEQYMGAGTCGADMPCIVEALTGSPSWKWLVVGQGSDESLVLSSKVNTSSSPPTRVAPGSAEREVLWKAVHEAIGLGSPTSPAPKPGRDPSDSKGGGPREGAAGWSESRVLTSSFVPLPGYPSLAQGDGAGVALALGVVVPSTALWVGAVGETGQSTAEFVGLSVLGFYASTVLTNQVVGLRSLRRSSAVVVTPTADGRGGTVTIGARLP